jgi:hypothetical protein
MSASSIALVTYHLRFLPIENSPHVLMVILLMKA